MLYKKSASAWAAVERGKSALLVGDCRELLRSIPDGAVNLILTSPPYCMGKEYEAGWTIEDFTNLHSELMPEMWRVLREGGSMCWQVGYHVKKNSLIPLDFLVYDAVRKFASPLLLRNRIVWHFGHGHHCDRRFSGRHETILWFTKGEKYTFNLDSVRVPQKYPGKKSSRGPKQGEFSGNPLGKNPSDVWDIPNVKANHVEKTDHPCQFPVSLATRLVSSLSNPGEVVFDPFCGVASTGVAAVELGRRFLGAELESSYADIGGERLKSALKGELRTRADVDVQQPDERSAVARRPSHFWPNGA